MMYIYMCVYVYNIYVCVYNIYIKCVLEGSPIIVVLLVAIILSPTSLSVSSLLVSFSKGDSCTRVTMVGGDITESQLRRSPRRPSPCLLPLVLSSSRVG